MRPHETRNDVEERTASKIASLTAENEVLRARLETVEAETRERCAQRVEQHIVPILKDEPILAPIAAAIRNLEPCHD